MSKQILTRINLDIIKGFDPCTAGLQNYIEHYSEFSGPPLEFLQLEKIPAQDMLWLILREGFIPKNDLHETARKFAERVLPIFEREYPNDLRPRKAIEAKRDFILGKITSHELAAARDAAWAA